MEDDRTGAEAEAEFWERINGPTPKPLAIETADMDIERGPGICGDTCRLGATCRVCKPPKAAPWVPSVDDFDLLPDA